MQNVGHAWSGTGKEVGTVSPGALNGLLLTWSRLRSFPGCGSFFLASRSDVEIADRWCRECPGDGARLRNKKAAEWDSGWSGAVDQSPWKSGSPWGKLWDDPPPTPEWFWVWARGPGFSMSVWPLPAPEDGPGLSGRGVSWTSRSSSVKAWRCLLLALVQQLGKWGIHSSRELGTPQCPLHGWAALLESLGDSYFGLNPLFYRSENLSPDKTNTLSSINKIQSGAQNQVSQYSHFLHVPQCQDLGMDGRMEHSVIRLQLTFCPPETSKQFSVLFSIDVEVW